MKEFPEAVLAPGISPGVLDDEVVAVSFVGAVADEQDGVVEGGGGALGGGEDSALVELETRRVERNGERADVDQGGGNLVSRSGRDVSPVANGVGVLEVLVLALAEPLGALPKGGLGLAVEAPSPPLSPSSPSLLPSTPTSTGSFTRAVS